jgi:DNA repair exonuclease SbcCD nuclease subunit
MRFLLLSDPHFRDDRPQYRIDDYQETQFTKMKWIIDTAKEQKCSYIIIAGDLFNSPRLSYFLTQRYIELFKLSPPILAVYGQHDLLFHTEYLNTPYKTFVAAKACIHLAEDGFICNPKESHHIVAYGCPWNKKVPYPKHGEQNFNILVIHKLFLHNKPLFPGQDAPYALDFLKKNPEFNLIVSGDNHQFFTIIHKVDKNAHYQVNCGSMMRQSIDQINYQPMVVLYDSATNMITNLMIPIKPGNKVFNIKEADRRKERKDSLDAFVEKISGTTEISGLDFLNNLNERLNKDDIDPQLKALGEEVIRDAAANLRQT